MTLAIFGGKPVRDTFLSYGKQYIDEEDIRHVVNILKSDYLTTGPSIKAFEDKVASYVDARYAVAVSNGTAALHTALYGCEVKEGDEVIVTPMTFAASSNAILYLGAKPVFADIDPVTYNIDPKDIERKITEKTTAIVTVDFAGLPVDLEGILKIKEKYKLKVVEDAAHALGSEYKGKKVGGYVDVTTFSFHPVKPITTGEGGMITTNNPDIYQKMHSFRTHGITRQRDQFCNIDEGPWYYEQQALGYNYRMTDIQAALGLSQMNKIDQFIDKRRKIAQLYNEAFRELEGVITPYESKDTKSGYHIYVIRLDLKRFNETYEK
jgi:perosamine synthetase